MPPDFTSLTRKNIADAKRPPALPGCWCPGIIKSYAFGDDNRNKTPYVRYQIGITGWGDEAPEEWEVFDPSSGQMAAFTQDDVDISKRQFRRDFFLTDEADWRLADFLKSLGLSGSFEEAIPQAVGALVSVEIQQQPNAQTGEMFNQIGGMKGA